ncbi:MAG TPA: formate dehydrogenase accessory sulfurtransferase FdhD [Pseudolabrys sp.]|nr:formate dehydrogenase accessory sulfurtransferase FdhD [Pseudolabrys sp.]
MSDTFITEISSLTVPAWRAVAAITLGPAGHRGLSSSTVAEEVPVAFRFNGFEHGVMMATPEALEDFALGFALTEGVISDPAELASARVREQDNGLVIEATLGPDALHRYLATRRVRRARGHTSCGLCGAEDLKDIYRTAPAIRRARPLAPVHVERALDALRAFQPISRLTRGAHASAWLDRDGAIRAVREDVGRHNALDKLIGAGLRGAFNPDDGFCLITSRCSFEMVQKAVMAGYATLVSAAAPTALAIRTAVAAGLSLYSLDRGRGQLLYTFCAEGDEP